MTFFEPSPDEMASPEFMLRTHSTYAVQGLIAVPAGATNFLPPFFFPVPPNQRALLVGVRYVVRGATSVTFNITQNGTAVITGAVATTTAGESDVTTYIDVNDGDMFAVLVTAISGTPDGLTVSFYWDVTGPLNDWHRN